MKPSLARFVLAPAVSLAALAGASCQSAYYSTLEKFGVHKRDILVDRVEEGREAQVEAKQEIVSTLEAFKAVANFDGGDLERLYGELKDRYDASAAAVGAVGDKIESIEEVSEDLFAEWKRESGEIQDAELRRGSEDMLRDTRARCATLIAAMKKAEAKMEPVLGAFKDRVLFLKHNLNAKAVAALHGQLVTIETDVGALISEMEKSIAEADAFIAAMDEETGK
jgi:hypothetical protein